MRAVVFDFDGVLADSMPQHAESFRRVLEPEGIPAPARRVFELEGMRSTSLIKRLAEDAGKNLTDEEAGRLGEAKQEVFEQLGTPRLYEGAADAVAAAAGIPRALVTGTRRENLDRVLGGLANRFDVLLAENAYTHDKPHPEPYALAAQQLGVDAGACVAVENAVLGIRSAREAGYARVVAIATTMPATDLAEADMVVADHAALADALRRIAAGALEKPNR